MQTPGYEQFAGWWSGNAQLALDAIAMKPATGIPSFLLHVMEWSLLEGLSGNVPGSYPREPERVYLEFQHVVGTNMIDQWIPDNPLSMTDRGYDAGTEHGATTGAEMIVRDGIVIDSPEAVVEHMERFRMPEIQRFARELEATADERVRELIAGEVAVQRLFGPDMLKVPYSGFMTFPPLDYSLYGYVNYFMAYALYPEVLERLFGIYADFAVKFNAIAARAIIEGHLPRLGRLDHDMADSRGTLVNIKSLDEIWFPHFARAIEPFHQAGIRLIWHCDGNLMAMVPRLLEVGIGGFQGFQYEDGMDYEKICRMKTRDGGDLFIIAGVSVTRTLPMGTPADVKREMRWLVDHGPKTGLFLAGTSSIAPRTKRENIETMIEGLQYFRAHGREGI